MKQAPHLILSEIEKIKEPQKVLSIIDEVSYQQIKDHLKQSYLESIHSQYLDNKLTSIRWAIIILQLQHILNVPSILKDQQHFEETLASLKESCQQALEGLNRQLMDADQQLRQCETKVKAFSQQQMFSAFNDFELKNDLQVLDQELNEQLRYPLQCQLQPEVHALLGQFQAYFMPNIIDISGSQNLGVIAELANELLESTYKVSKKLQDYLEYMKSFERLFSEKAEYHKYKLHVTEELKNQKEQYQNLYKKCLKTLQNIENGKEASSSLEYRDQLQNVENLLYNTEQLLQKKSEQIVPLYDLKQLLQQYSSLPDMPTLFENLQNHHEKQQSQIKNQELAKKKQDQEQQIAFAKKRHEAEKAQKKFKDQLKQATDRFNQLQSEMHHHPNSQDALKQLDALRRELQSLMQLDHDNDELLKHAADPSSLEHNLILDRIIQNANDGISKLSEIEKDIELKRKSKDEAMALKQQKEAIQKEIDELQNYQLPDLKNQIQEKLDEIVEICGSSQKLAQAMMDNPDFHEKKQMLEHIQKGLEQVNQENIQLNAALQSLEQTRTWLQKKATGKLDVQQLEALKEEYLNHIKNASEINAQADTLLSKANKLIGKLKKHCTIQDIIDEKRKALDTLSELIKDCECQINDSQSIQSPEIQKQMKGISKLLRAISNQKNALATKLEQLENSDMSNSNDDQTVKMLNDLKEIGEQLNTKVTDLNNIKSQLQHIRTKHSEEDYQRRVEYLNEAIDQSQSQINHLKKQYELLQELCDEFTGYCSDEQDTQLVSLLGQQGELKEIIIQLRTLALENDQLQDTLSLLKDSNKERKDQQFHHSQLCDLEAQVKNHLQNVKDAEQRIERHIQSANTIDGNQKVSKRQREIEELDRKIGQMDIIIQRIYEESQLDINKAQSDGLTDDKQKLIGEMQQLQKELLDLQNDLEERLMKHIQEVKDQVNFLQNQVSTLTNMDILKRSKRLKKQILGVLKQAQLARNSFNDLRTRYESCKLRLRTIPKYKPLQGDDLDRMLAEWIQVNSCPIPIERLGDGYYRFGQKKIYAKITNGKLVIRVGGGYMGIDEFMYYYGAQELNKMLAYEGLDDIVEEINLDQIIRQEKQSNKNIIQKFDDGKVVIGGQKFKQRLSPNRRTGSINGRMSANDGRSSPGAAAYYQSNISPGRMSPGSSASRANANMFLKIQKQSSVNSTVKSVQIIRDGGSPKDSSTHNSNKVSTNCLQTAATMDTLPSVGKTEQPQNNHLALEHVATSAFQVTIAKRSPQRKASGSGIMLQNYASADSYIATNPKKDQLSMTTNAIYNQYLKHQVNGIIGNSSIQQKISPKIDKQKQNDANEVSFSRANSSFGEVNKNAADKDQSAPPKFKILELMKEKKVTANQSKSALNK